MLLEYEVNTEVAIEILEGRFVVPVGTDGPTQLIFNEIANIQKKMEGGKVDTVVTIYNFKHHWRCVKNEQPCCTLSCILNTKIGHSLRLCQKSTH